MGRDHLGWVSCVGGMMNIKLDVGFMWLDIGSCEERNDAADFMKGGEFLDLLVQRIFDFQKKAVIWS
jgi:hypothetical protein